MKDLTNQRITIIGAARSGIAAVHTAKQLGSKVKISEFKPRTSMEDAQYQSLVKEGIALEFGGHTPAFIEDSDVIVLSPGVRQDITAIAAAKARGIEVIGEVEFAYRLCPCPIVAVTGSNGKTTTSTLIAEILKKAGRSVCLCGNIGSALSGYVLKLKAEDIVVLEISSFQLESTVSFKPKVAVWLNFSQNHLDRHKDLDEYFNAKARIVANQDETDVAVLNAADARLKAFAQNLRTRVVFFNTPDDPADIRNPNYLAAMKAVLALGVDEEICRQVFKEFRGVEHRLEFVRQLGGVDYINDSKSTTAEAGRWALTQSIKPVVMICGGRDKHIDFSVLRDLVKSKVHHMMAIGEARGIMKEVFGDLIPVDEFTDFQLAIQAAQRVARPGDAVLLSPMCASFDMFTDYEHRGKVYKEIVNQLL